MLAAALCATGLSTGTAAQPAAAAGWPDRPLRLVVPFPPGGINDLIARIIGNRLAEQLQQTVVIDNRAGAGGTVGLGIAARANPDGYTLAFGATSTVAVSPALYRNLPYDPVKGFVAIALPHMKSGKVRALAVTSPARLPILPDLPTVAEAAGLPGYDLMIWFGILAPAGTPRPIVQRLNGEIIKSIASPEVQARFAQQGATRYPPQTPEQFGAYIQSEIKRWAEVARVSGARVD